MKSYCPCGNIYHLLCQYILSAVKTSDYFSIERPTDRTVDGVCRLFLASGIDVINHDGLLDD